MFPFDLDENEDNTEEIEGQEIPTDFEIDFKTGKLTGRIISGVDAVKQWARLVLSIDRYYFTQYSWDFGAELSELIGQGGSREYIESEVEMRITDALMTSEYIESVGDFEIEVGGDTITARFTIETAFEDSEVEINV